MFDTVLFDLDGTLTDPFEGISNSIIYALKKFGIAAPDKQRRYAYRIAHPRRDGETHARQNEFRDCAQAFHRAERRHHFGRQRRRHRRAGQTRRTSAPWRILFGNLQRTVRINRTLRLHLGNIRISRFYNI